MVEALSERIDRKKAKGQTAKGRTNPRETKEILKEETVKDRDSRSWIPLMSRMPHRGPRRAAKTPPWPLHHNQPIAQCQQCACSAFLTSDHICLSILTGIP